VELKALEVGWPLSQHQQILASAVGTGDPPLCLFRRYSASVNYTTNAIESMNMTLRKATRNHRIFPSDEAVFEVNSLAMRNITTKWTMPVRERKPALNHIAVECAARFPR
jgi:transposase-like protein